VVQHRGRRGLRRVTQQAAPWIESHRG
jgi:hypothetical protein